MSTDDKGHNSSFTVITSAVDDPCITDTTPTHGKASHMASLAAEYEPGCAKAFAALCRIFSANVVLTHSCQSTWQGFVMQ